MSILQRIANADPRYFQITILSSLLIAGCIALHFAVTMEEITLILATVFLMQWLCCHWKQLPFDVKSPLITGLSLCLLLRSPDMWVLAAAAAIAIASKFTLRIHGKHLFNPANAAIAVALIFGVGWVSPGQWGQDVLFLFAMTCLGAMMVNKAWRSDVALMFLVVYVSLVMARAIWLNDPLAIAFHQLQNGALVLFAFFMISDPKTSPDSRKGRIVFATMVAVLAYIWQFEWYRADGIILALTVTCLLTPLLDKLFPDEPYEWAKKEVSYGA